ncbi:MAG: hypothetical protein E7447_05220 [Ruminococcaceae bacterium]|nr:hypothetical protein [Oscillospiraceae bacterium]
MERFFQASAGMMAAVILWIILSRQGKEYALLLSIGACCLVIVVMLRFLEPVLSLLQRLQDLGGLQQQWLGVLLKAVGIGLITEMGALICNDAGNAAMGKTLQILGSAAVLWLSIPLVNSLLELLEKILGGI